MNKGEYSVKLCFGPIPTGVSHKKSVPGWNDYLIEARTAASDDHSLWRQWNKPSSGPVFQLMQRSRAQYKYVVRLCRRHKSQTKVDILGQSLATKSFSTFWKMTSKTNNHDPVFSNKVGFAVGASDSCDF